MIKRILAGAVACSMLAASFLLFGCSSDEGAASQDGDAKEATQQQPESDYAVSIDACDVVSNHEGNPAIVLTYTWTNNSEDAQMFGVVIDDKVFQNGIELSFTTLPYDNETYDLNAYTKEIQPGTTQTVYLAYELEDQSEVTVQCEETFSFDDVVLAEATFSVA